jgi:uncharacterized protein
MEEKTKIFIDSNVFISYFNELDAKHHEATLLVDAITATHTELVINNFVFVEVATIVSMRLSKEASLYSGELLLTNPNIHLIILDENLHHHTWEIFKKIRKKNISFTDCSIVATMDAEGIRQLATFDTTDFKSLQKQHRFKIIT